jgi:hypothetical protein
MYLISPLKLFGPEVLFVEEIKLHLLKNIWLFYVIIHFCLSGSLVLYLIYAFFRITWNKAMEKNTARV